MKLTIPEESSLILIQEIDPWRHLGGDNFEYRPPMLVVGEEWGRIDRHQRGIVRSNQDVMEFTGIVPSADHDTQKHVDGMSVTFGKMKFRHLEPTPTTTFCVEHQARLNDLVDRHAVKPEIIVRDREAAMKAHNKSLEK